MTRVRPEVALVVAALAGGLPAVLVALALLPRAGLAPEWTWLVVTVLVGFWLGGAALLRRRAAYRLRTVSNLLAAVREGDYSFRARGGRRSDAFGELVLELNLLARTLRSQRFDDVEATALLGKVMAEIDAAVLAFDAERRLRLVNRAGERLLGGSEADLLGRAADELGLSSCLEGASSRTVDLGIRGESRRWELRRGAFRQQGRPLQLVVLFDVSRSLRAEELAAWRRLIRVIGHELNNSLAPIKSITGSLERLAASQPLPEDWRDDLSRGLRVIGSRAEALNRFMGAYASFAKLPEPRPIEVEVAPLVRRVAGLETRVKVEIDEGPSVSVRADPDQIEQALINLVRNAADSCAETGGGVRIGWAAAVDRLELWVLDEGPGLAETANLFVPFFTTKPGGSGIGLVLVRQIAEAHGGEATLTPRSDRSGCRATVRLPLGRP